MEKKKMKILFVCFGNICRSPTAEGVFRQIVKDEGLDHVIHVDSAGTAGYHIGDPADPRSVDAAMQRGYDISDHRGRRIETPDFDEFDYILAMDQENYSQLAAICTTGNWGKLKLFMEYASGFAGKEVPDPYYGGQRAFELVLDMVESASRGLLKEVREKMSITAIA